MTDDTSPGGLGWRPDAPATAFLIERGQIVTLAERFVDQVAPPPMSE